VRLKLKTIVSAPFDENTYIACLEGRSDCLVIDPGLQPGKILSVLEAEKLTPAAILNTHGHSDHIAGNQAMKDRWPDCPLVIGRLDAPKLTDPQLNLSAPFGLELISPSADVLLDEGDKYSAAGFDLAVRHIPGHSIGHIVFIWSAGSPTFVLGGDVLFAGSIGRTDFPDGSFEQLAAGIREKLYVLPDDTIVLPGHGSTTTIGQEKRSNPFVPA
jgi:hydroxyacylglutathione hydrolase